MASEATAVSISQPMPALPPPSAPPPSLPPPLLPRPPSSAHSVGGDALVQMREGVGGGGPAGGEGQGPVAGGGVEGFDESSWAFSSPPSSSSSSRRPFVRRSGFSRPFHPLQVTSWVLMACCVVVYFSLTVPFVPQGHSAELVSFSVLYCVIFAVGFGVYLAVSLSDPYTHTASAAAAPATATGAASAAAAAPPPLVEQPPPPVASSVDAALPYTAPAAAAATAAAGMSLPVSTAPPPPPAQRPLCLICGAVQTPTTKHCYLDGRCVDGFDHHCIYLNLCVGRANYHLFFAFVSLVTALLTLQLFVTVWLLAHINDDPYRDTVDTSDLSHPLAWLLLLSIVSVIPALCLVGISTLQCFHCYLVATAQSTYQFIVRRRAELDERRRQWEAQQRQWQWQQQRQQMALQGGQPPLSSEPALPSADGPVIVLTERQRAEQAEWLKAHQGQQRGVQQLPSLHHHIHHHPHPHSHQHPHHHQHPYQQQLYPQPPAAAAAAQMQLTVPNAQPASIPSFEPPTAALATAVPETVAAPPARLELT